VTAWQDHAAAPHIGDHGGHAGSFAPGFAGMLAAGVMAGGPGGYAGGSFGFREGYGDYWAYRALGAGMGTPAQHQMTRRPDVTRGRLIPAGDDLAALTAAGDDPTVLAFMLASTGDRVVFDVLNLAEPPTLVFRSAGQDDVGVINRALVDSGFKTSSAVLADLFVGQVRHDGNWSSQLATLLAGRVRQ